MVERTMVLIGHRKTSLVVGNFHVVAAAAVD
jgi:hypothetical protein